MDNLEIATLTVPTGQSVSDAIDLAGRDLMAVLAPGNMGGAGVNGPAVATAIGLEFSIDGQNFAVGATNGPVTSAPSAQAQVLRFSLYQVLVPAYQVVAGLTHWRAVRWMRLRVFETVNGNPSEPLVQSADRQIQLVLRTPSIKLSC